MADDTAGNKRLWVYFKPLARPGEIDREQFENDLACTFVESGNNAEGEYWVVEPTGPILNMAGVASHDYIKDIRDHE
jgi:hypothetical protein